MTTNVQNTRPIGVPADPPVVDPVIDPVPVVTPTGVGGVAVYDRYEDEKVVSSRPSAALGHEGVPVATQSSGSILTWIIAAIVVIVLAYFLIQFIF
jgi:hypothetical protein